MKKYPFNHQFLITVVLCLSTIAIVTSSCSKDEPSNNHKILPGIITSKSWVECDYYGGVIDPIMLDGDFDGCQLTINSDWLSDSYLDYDRLVIIVDKNNSYSDRTGDLTLSNSYHTTRITVKQSGKNSNVVGENGAESQLTTPTGVAAVNIGSSDNPIVQVSWDNVQNATLYRVIKTYPKEGGYEIKGHFCNTSVLVDTEKVYAVDYNVSIGTAYEYQVSAYATGFEHSDWSAITKIDI